MKLDRNVKGGHGNKYGLIKNRELEKLRDTNGQMPPEITGALLTLVSAGLIDWGCTPETEFFVMRLKDIHARAGLIGYGVAAREFDREYGEEVLELAFRSGANHPNCKAPD